MSVFSRMSSTDAAAEFEQLVQENEQMLGEITALRPECDRLRAANNTLQIESREQCKKIVALEQERQCLREEGDRLRSIVVSARQQQDDEHHKHVASVSQHAVNSLRETADARHKSLEEHMIKVRSDIQLVLAMQHQAAEKAGHAEAAHATAVAAQSSQREMDDLRARLAQRTEERDEALERIRLMQAQWEATQQEARALSSERLTLRERADQLVASANVTGADVTNLIADIFDSCEVEIMELKNKVATREMLRNDDKQRHSQEVTRLLRSNKDLGDRLQRALRMVEATNTGESSPLAIPSAVHLPTSNSPLPEAGQPAERTTAVVPSNLTEGAARTTLRRVTLSRSQDGLVSARSHVLADSPGENGVVYQTSPGRSAAQQPQSLPSPTTSTTPVHNHNSSGDVVQCPRCTFDNEPTARFCFVCNMPLVARQHRHRPNSSVSPPIPETSDH